MKYFSLLLLLLLFINTNTAMAAERISVTVNGNPVNFNTEPRIINDRTLIQIRPVVEAFGCSVVWDDATKTSYINQSGYPLNKTATLGNDINVYVNNNRIDFPDQKPVNVDGFVMIPSRTVVEALGGAVVWDNRSKTQIISTDKTKIPARKFDFRNSNWGDDIETVKRNETARFVESGNDRDGNEYLVYKENDKESEIYYGFDNNSRLSWARYYYQPKHPIQTELGKASKEYNSIKNDLTKKYGEPKYAERASQIYLARWDTDTSTIYLELIIAVEENKVVTSINYEPLSA